MFNPLLGASVLAVLAVAVADPLTTTAFTNGAYVRARGTRNLRGTTLVVPVNLLNPRYAQEALDTANSLLHEIVTTWRGGPSRISALQASLNHYNDTLSLLRKPKKTRTRRGLLNLGGTVLQHLFGVATQQELDLMHESMVNASEIFTTATKTLQIKSAVLQDAVGRLTSAMKIELAISTRNMNHTMKQINTNRQLGLVSDLILTVASIIDALQSTVAMLHSGTYLRLINKKDLADIIEQANTVIPHGERFFCSLEEPWTYISSHLIVKATNAPTVFALHLPFVRSEEYNLFEIATLPKMTKT